jgi:hypothetical protein
VHSKFFINKIWKKMKSPNSMRNESVHTPKCRGKVQKMEVLYFHSLKMLGLHNLLITSKKKSKKSKKSKNRKLSDCQTNRAVVLCLSWAGALNSTFPKKKSFLPSIFLHMWSTLVGWLHHMHALPKLLLKFSNTHNF